NSPGLESPLNLLSTYSRRAALPALLLIFSSLGHGLRCGSLLNESDHNRGVRSSCDSGENSMKRLLMAGLGLVLAVSFSAFAPSNKADDASAVRATVRNYIEAYYTGDARRMEQTLHPHYLKH